MSPDARPKSISISEQKSGKLGFIHLHAATTKQPCCSFLAASRHMQNSAKCSGAGCKWRLSFKAHLKFLLTADLHLGRSSSGLPQAALGCGISLSSREAWSRIVDSAISQRVEAVLIAGDLVESAVAFYESLGPLADGFKKLVEHGIDVFAIAGNHDAVAFEKIAVELSGMHGVHFMGRGGVWERMPLIRDGRARAFVDGWSFPSSRYPANPTENYRLPGNPGVPTLGLLHADLEKTSSHYAPCTIAKLRDCAPDFWTVGHTHKPGLIGSPSVARVLVPGSPQALDFGETGAHGVWLLDAEDPQLLPVFQQISTVRFEDTIRIDLTSSAGVETLEHALLAECRREIETFPEQEKITLRCVIHRVTAEGEWEHPEVLAALSNHFSELIAPAHEGIQTFFDGTLRDETILPLDLPSLEQRGGALGELASRHGQLLSGECLAADWFLDLHSRVLAAFQACPLAGDEEYADDSESGNGPSAAGAPQPELTRAWLLARSKRLLVAARNELK